MKKILLSLSLFIGFGASAQLPDGSIAPDFTLTDITGTSHNLYTYLNQGKTVFIDVSATWCGPCWNFHGTYALRDLWQQHGPLGGNSVNANSTNDVIVIFIEGDGSTNTSDLHGTGSNTQGDWVTGVPHPVIDPPASAINSFNTNYAIGFFPTIYMICPNRTIKEVGQMSATQLYAQANSCPEPVSSPNDAIYGGLASATSVCTPLDYLPKVKVQNNGMLPITSAEVVVRQNGQVISTGTFSGTLASYGIATVTCSEIAGFNGGQLDIEIVYPNDANLSNNTSTVNFQVSIETSNVITIDLTTDGYASETTWSIQNSLGTNVTGTTNPSLANNTNYVRNYTLANTGCYTFKLSDSYGDGLIDNSNIDGTVNISDSYGTVLHDNADFGDGVLISFKVTSIVGSPTLSSTSGALSDTVLLCFGQTYDLSSSLPNGNVWSNGSTTRNITIGTSGSYYVTNDNVNSDTVVVIVSEEMALTQNNIVQPTCNANTDGSIEVNGTGTGNIEWNGGIELNVSFPFTLNNLSAGIYSVKLLTSNCTSNELTIVLNDLSATTPSITAGGATTICEGNSVTLTSSEASDNLWSNSEMTQDVVITSSGSYYLTQTDIDGCVRMSDPIEVIVNSNPVITNITDQDVCIGDMLTLNAFGASNITWDNGITNNVAFQVMNTLTYAVTAEDNNGCLNTSSVTVNAMEIPTISTSGNVSACLGSDLTLNATSEVGNTIYWNNTVQNGVSFSAYANTFTATAVSPNGCFISDQVTVSLNPKPIITFSLPATVCKYVGSLELSALPAGGTFTGSNVIGNAFNVSSIAINIYPITYTSPANADGCTSKMTKFIQVALCASIDENSVENLINIYPNPTSDKVTLEVDPTLFNNVEVLDITGRVIYSVNIANNSTIIDLSNMNKGTYLLLFSGHANKATKQVVVK
jgi:hypothetical protein